jgi:hypothetical protein
MDVVVVSFVSPDDTAMLQSMKLTLMRNAHEGDFVPLQNTDDGRPSYPQLSVRNDTQLGC